MAQWNPHGQHAHTTSDYSNWTNPTSAQSSPGVRQETNLHPLQGWMGAEEYQHNKGNESHDGMQTIADLLKKTMGNQQKLILQQQGKEHDASQIRQQDWYEDSQWNKNKGKQIIPTIKTGKNLGRKSAINH